MSELDEILELLGASYSDWKAAESEKNEHKDVFFRVANDELKKQGLAIRLEILEAESLEEAETRVLLHNPGWEVDTKRPHRFKENVYEFVLIEDPSLKAFSHEYNGMKYARRVSKGAVMVDDDWLQQEEPELYEQITFPLPWGERIVIPVEHLPEALLRRLTKYIYNDKPRVSLAPPREVKDEV